MHRIEANILHHAKKRREQRKFAELTTNKLNYIIMNKKQLIRQIKFIIDGVELSENPFFIINKIKNIIEQETQTE